MPKSKPSRQRPASTRQPDIPPPQPGTIQVSLGCDPKGKMEPRDVVSSKEGWSEYTLDDESVIRVKAVILDVKRAVDQYGLDGNPIYVMQFAFVNQLTVPDNLKKQG
jgi:hypothetical protein